jgi:hypothetical protein
MIILATVVPVHGQTVDQKLWVPNASYNAIARHDNAIYLAGPFTVVGP